MLLIYVRLALRCDPFFRLAHNTPWKAFLMGSIDGGDDFGEKSKVVNNADSRGSGCSGSRKGDLGGGSWKDYSNNGFFNFFWPWTRELLMPSRLKSRNSMEKIMANGLKLQDWYYRVWKNMVSSHERCKCLPQHIQLEKAHTSENAAEMLT